MRPSLPHPLREPRQRRRHRDRRGAEPLAAAATPATHSRPSDPDVERVREAGGPIDRAAYACACGYVFSAAVSTTVRCPHCGAGQAW